jgi:hypothetical protein
MTPSPARPPVLAHWLVELFALERQVDSMQGDLLEEFSELASRCGIRAARRWYWRQSLKTFSHLLLAALRESPALFFVFVFGGCLLLAYSMQLPERAIVGIFDWRPAITLGIIKPMSFGRQMSSRSDVYL